MGEVHVECIGSSLPGGAGGPWNFANPLQHVGASVAVLYRLGDEPERVVAAPLLPLLLQAVEDNFVGLLLIELLVHR